MALRPYRQYADTDVLTQYSLDGTGEAGSAVQFKAWASGDHGNPSQYNTGLNLSAYAGTFIPTHEVIAQVELAGTSGSATPAYQVAGILLQDVKSADDNSLPLNQFTRRAEELGAAISGEAVAVLTRGIVVTNRWESTTAAVNGGSGVRVSDSADNSGLLEINNAEADNLIGRTLAAVDEEGYVMIQISVP